MKISVSLHYLRHNYDLTLESDVNEDLSRFDVEARIAGVLRRELGRAAEITAVGLQDLERAKKADEETLQRKRSGARPEPKRPTTILAAGTKDVKTGRIVVP